MLKLKPPNRRLRRIRLVAAVRAFLALIAVTACATARAWEADVHYGLTFWLAMEVGYERMDAASVAEGDQGIDDSTVTGPVISTVLSSCVSRDASGAGARSVQEHHFPSKYPPPATPQRREVVAGEVWYNGAERSPPPCDGSRTELLRLGEYLHALQDTWSHRGPPDPPRFCDAEYAWGHAKQRGGWPCHLADLSFRWVDQDVVPMAKATYDVLTGARGGTAKASWVDLEGKIREFASRQSKWDKHGWFDSQGIDASAFLPLTSLPDCTARDGCRTYPYEVLVIRWKRLAALQQPSVAGLPADLAAVVLAFLKALDAQVGVQALAAMVDARLADVALAYALGVRDNCADLYLASFEFSFGRAFADGSGAYHPLSVCELAATITPGGSVSCTAAAQAMRDAARQPLRRGPGLAAMRERLGGLPSYLFSAATSTKDGALAVVAEAHFAHLPRDKLVLRAAYVDPGDGKKIPKIVSAIWAPSE